MTSDARCPNCDKMSQEPDSATCAPFVWPCEHCGFDLLTPDPETGETIIPPSIAFQGPSQDDFYDGPAISPQTAFRDIHCILMEGVPAFQRVIDGKPLDLKEVRTFIMPQVDGTLLAIPAATFFVNYLPSRVMFAGAGHG